VSAAGTIFLQSQNFIDAMYIVAFSLFIYGLSGLTGPRTAVRGNLIAATGMAIAVVATFLVKGVWDGSSTPWLIVLGLVLGTAVGIPAARNVRMTAMPQMVALFNGVGGGAVALIAWIEYRHHFRTGFHDWPLRAEIPSLFGAIIGSVSFWGSGIAFGKLQEILPGRPIKLPGQTFVNVGVFIVALTSAIVLAAGTHSQALFILGVLVAAAILGNVVVLPIGGADMPVVISLLNAFTGLSAAATGIALGNTALIVAGMIVGASGSILTNLMAKAMNRSVPAIIAGGFGGAVAAPAAGGPEGGTVRSTSAQDVAIQLSYARLVVIAKNGASRSSTPSIPSPAACRGT
jgi:NAD(P) transhydrogenase subunit beta